MPQSICYIPGCAKPVKSRGFCNAHHQEAWKAGLPKNEFHAWMASVANGKAHPSIIQFAEDVERGASIAEASFVDTIVDDVVDKADNAKWMLERTRSRDFSPKVTTVVTTELESAIDRLLSEFRNEPLLQERILKALTSGNE